MDSKAERNEQVERHLGFVAKRVRARNFGVYDEDLYQEGVIGLMKAAERFDATKGYPFWGFAIKYVDGHIQNARNKDQLIKRDKNGYSRIVVHSLDVPVGEEGDTTFGDLIPDRFDMWEEVISSIQLDELVTDLSDQATKIVYLLLLGMTDHEVALRMGIKQNNVNKFKRKIVKKLSERRCENAEQNV